MNKSKTAVKLISFFMVILMAFGAFPVALAADGDIVTKWPTAVKEIEYGQKYADAGLTGGESTIPGKFEYVSTTAAPNDVKVVARPVQFVPDDTSVAPVEGTVDVTVIQSKSAVLEGGLPTASNIQAGQKLSDSVITKTGIKFMNYGKAVTNWKCRWKEPDKVMNKAGTFTETVECYPGLSSYQKKIASIWVDVQITVEGDAADTVIVEQLPTATDVTFDGSQRLSDSKLSGGVVLKGGNPVAGKFDWKDPRAILSVGTHEYDVVFTPDDSAVCEPIEMKVPVTVTKVEMVVTWPTLRGHYKVNGVVRDCVTFEGGSCTVPGKFEFDGAHYLDKIPATMGESMEVYIKFVPDNKKLYDEVYNSFMVTFDPADPDCQVGYFISNDYKEYDITCRIASPQNWDMHTGKYYLILDGKRFELDKPTQTAYYKYTDLAAGEHTIQAVYEAGENDVYSDGKSDIKTFTVATFYKVNVTDCTGATTLEYLPGRTVSVTAPIHDKPYYDFTGWTAEGVELTEEEAAKQSVSFTMPEGEVNLTANYKFNFKNFIKYVFEQLGAFLLGILTKGVEYIKGLIQNIPR